MEIAPLAPSSFAAATAGRPDAPAAVRFSSLLDGQQQLEAARAVLQALPAPIVYSLRDRGGSPAESVDRLFEVLQDGSFTPPAGPLGAPGSIIGATAHASTVFDSPDQLWEAMRTVIGDPASTAAALRASPAPAAPAAPAEPLPEVRTLEDAERLLTQVRAAPTAGAPAPLSMSERDADWWDAALRFLLGASFPA